MMKIKNMLIQSKAFPPISYLNKEAYKKARLKDLLSTDFYTNKKSILELKVESVVEYLTEHAIKDVTVGFSGGADSTLVLLLLVLASHEIDLKIHAVTIIPEDKSLTSFEPETALEILKHRMFKYVNTLTLTHSVSNIFEDSFKGYHVNEHTKHQAYYQTMYSLLFTHSQIVGGLTIGTTNLDELSYVGWFGKNSDMVVDLQIISDMHKFEVAAILNLFKIKIPKAPTGDIPGGITDEEYFGIDYDSLSYHSYCKCNNLDSNLDLPLIEKLHSQNYHKYLGQTFNPIFLVDTKRFFICKV